MTAATLDQLALGISEAVFQSRIEAECRLLGIRWHHETDSRRSPKGWPDLALCGPRGVALAELKRQESKYKVTDQQAEWLAALVDSRGVLPCVWRPADWSHVQLVLHRLAGRRPHQLLIDAPRVTRHRIRFAPDDAGRLERIVGDFSTRRDAELVHAALGRPDLAEVVSE